jgi:hypothetical protein
MSRVLGQPKRRDDMTVDNSSDDIFDWPLVQEAARVHRQRVCGDRKNHTEIDQRRRSPGAGNQGVSSTKSAAERKVADCLPFPLVRRRAFISRLIAQIMARPVAAGEVHLVQQLRRQAVVLQRKGVEAALIRRELRAVETAVRAGLWRAVFDTESPGGAA